MVTQSTKHGCLSPAQLLSLAPELSLLTEPGVDARGCGASPCFPFSVFDPVIGTAWP